MTTLVDPAELDRPDLHDLGALVGELEHLLVADDVELAGVWHEPWVGGVDAADVGEDLASIGAAAPRPGRPPSCRCRRVRAWSISWSPDGRRALALEAGDDDDLAALDLGADPARLDAGDARPAVACRRW